MKNILCQHFSQSARRCGRARCPHGHPGERRPVGHELSRQLAEFTATCYDGSGFHLADQRGEVIYNKVSSVSPELMKALYEEASK